MKKTLFWLIAAVFCGLFASCTKSGEVSFGLSVTNLASTHNGGSYEIYYAVYNSSESDIVSCSSNVTWISGFDCSTLGTVKFNIDSNTMETSREGMITIIYSYADGSYSGTVSITQAGAGGEVNFSRDDIIGSYTATATSRTSSGTDDEATWTMNIMDKDGEDFYIDGLMPFSEGQYEEVGDHSWSAVAHLNSNGEIVVPSIILDNLQYTNYGAYYIAYTPMYVYDTVNGYFYYDATFPDLTFTYHPSIGTWESDYGVLCVGCTEMDNISSVYINMSVVYPPISIVKTSDEVPSSTGEGSAKAPAFKATKAVAAGSR